MLVRVNPTHFQQYSHDAWKYDYDFEHLLLSGANLTGRYPIEGWAYNNFSKIVYLVFDGSIKVTMENEYAKLVKGDVFVIEKGKKFYVEPYMCDEAKIWMIDTPKSPKGVSNPSQRSNNSDFFS